MDTPVDIERFFAISIVALTVRFCNPSENINRMSF